MQRRGCVKRNQNKIINAEAERIEMIRRCAEVWEVKLLLLSVVTKTLMLSRAIVS